MSEPSRVEVLAWLERTGRPVPEAVTHFWPDLLIDARTRRCEQVRKWTQRARLRAAKGSAAPVVAPTPPRAPTRQPDPPAAASAAGRAVEEASLGRVEFLRGQLHRLLEHLETAGTRGDLRAIPAIDKRVTEVRAELDQALELERQVVRLDRTATAICLELQNRAEAIRIRAEIERRNRERNGKEG